MDRMTQHLNESEAVIGIDSHKHTATGGVVERATQRVVDIIEVDADEAGYRRLLEQVPDVPRVWAVEGAGCYGSGLVRFLVARDETVVEVERPHRPARRHGAKSDPIDAVRAAREVLARDRQAVPKQHGRRAALAMRLAARRSAVQSATDAQRQLLALVITAPPALQDRLRGLATPKLVQACSRMRGPKNPDVEIATAVTVMRGLAKRVLALKAEAADHDRALRELVSDWRPDLLELTGVGPIVAATVLAAWSHPGRIHSEAAFAQLAGVAPLQASSGTTTRHRLNRHGDRQLNRALHVVAINRCRMDPETQAYVERRRAAGKTDREIRRCIKRYIARQLFRQLENHPTPT